MCCCANCSLLLPAADHGKDFTVTNRYRYGCNWIFLDEEIGYFVIREKALRLFWSIIHGKHGFTCKAALADQFVIGHLGKQPCSDFFGKLVKHVCASTGGVVNPVCNDTGELNLVAHALLLDSHAEAVSCKDAVEIVRGNNDGIIGIVKWSAETTAHHITKHIEQNDVIFIVEAKFLKQGD